MKYAIAKRIRREAEQVKAELQSLVDAEVNIAVEVGTFDSVIDEGNRRIVELGAALADARGKTKSLAKTQATALEDFKKTQAIELENFKRTQDETSAFYASQLATLEGKLAEAQGAVGVATNEKKSAADRVASLPARRKSLEKKLEKLSADLPAAEKMCADIEAREAERKKTLAAIEEQRLRLKKLKEAKQEPAILIANG